MVSLEELKNYCDGKDIIIVGNSSRILNGKYQKLIDGYDIVVRINKGYLHRQNIYSDKIGTKTNILSMGIKSENFSKNIIQSNTVNYIISPIIYSDRLHYSNVYDVQKNVYDELRSSLDGVKPSTGISTYNFFNRHINFKRLDLIGFDFFTSSSRQRNQLGHCYVSDHNGEKELEYFKHSKDPEKTMLHPIEGNLSTTDEINIPRFTLGDNSNYKIKRN
tara:strand:+ start:173 stop:829 length:657 start_codon:yes stop_codon:yes gene_type:complete